MKRNLIILIILACFSCKNDKVIQLPEINNSEISEINDVSAAYIFYNESKPDSTELNRKNLISTTNWLVNIDKRLTLSQVIPHIKYLQEKKSNSSHKNNKAKNYFTCHDTNENNLGFIEFTPVIYQNKPINTLIENNINTELERLIIFFNRLNSITIYSKAGKTALIDSNATHLKQDLLTIIKNQKSKTNLVLSFNKDLTFQDYISLKSILSAFKNQPISISNIEFISN
ncbi:hypothetical protein [Algibacter mikhailovii]|uniref:hypothetical protein n=1 Tax=Algibacter mikhailovii TaxID=425498 RepID=UPI00249465D5|nr:hypothetical protein [Algibacter mikhailovii]